MDTVINEKPIIDRINAKIGVLERRLAHLEQRIENPDRRRSSKDFDLAEAGALRAAIKCMRYVGVVR